MKTSVLVRFLVCAALTAPLLAGCGGGGSGGPAPAPRSVSATLPDGLVGTLTEDRSVVPAGGAVTYTLTLTNGTTQPITYQPLDAQGGLWSTQTGGAFQVEQGTGPQMRVVYDRSCGCGLAANLGPSVTLQPGQSVSAPFPVGPVPGSASPFSAPGQYQAVASFGVAPGTNNDLSALKSVNAAPLTVTVP